MLSTPTIANVPTTTLAVIPANIPAALAERDQWVAWRFESRDDRWTKIPVNARTGRRASATDPGTWSTLGEALAFRGEHAGIGYVFSPDDPFTGVDLDGCRDPHTGELTAEAAEIVARLDSYTELSPSGTGVHVIVEATLPPGRRRTGALEMYDRDRFFTVTAHRIAGTPAGVEPRQTALDDLYLETFPPAPPRQPQLVTGASPGSASLEDTELIERARSARNGGKFAALWGGDLSGHAGDESAADLALLSMLAFWTSDEDQLDRVFRLSGLYRDKWERLDYRARTIARALERSQHYTAPVRPTVRPMPQDAASAPDGPVTADDLPDDLTALKLIVLDLRAEVAGLRDQVGDERRARLAAEERAERSARLRRQTTRALGNPHLAQERVTAVAVAYEMEANEAAGTPTDDDGFHRMPLARLAERAGTSTDTVSRHVKRLADLGALDRKVIAVTIDRETGEILSPPRLEQWVRPKTDADGFIESVATLVPAKPKPQWGGLKTCPDHPGAKIVKRTTVTCADCGRVLLEKSSDPMPHPATLADPPMPHLAASGDDAAVDEMPDPAGAGYRAAVDVTIGRKTPEWSAPPAQPAIPGSIAAEWLAGAKPHGEPGNDRWTNS